MNTTVIIILIGCATVVALTAIICDHLFEKKTEPTESLISNKIIKIHRNYIAGFLGFAVVMLITSKYGCPNNAIFDYLSFGSTITAMVLSILAIFVTVQSSSDMYKQFTRIDNATDTIKTVSKQIEGTLNALKTAEIDLQHTSNSISNQLDNIVEQIDERIKAQMKESEGNISKTIVESMNMSSKITEQDANQNQNNIDELKTVFLDSTSSNGLLAIYACALSKEYGIMFELSDLFSWNLDYTFGFLIATSSIGLIDFSHDNKNNQITCNSSHFLSSEILMVLKNRQESKIINLDYSTEKINNINKHFGIDEK